MLKCSNARDLRVTFFLGGWGMYFNLYPKRLLIACCFTSTPFSTGLCVASNMRASSTLYLWGCSRGLSELSDLSQWLQVSTCETSWERGEQRSFNEWLLSLPCQWPSHVGKGRGRYLGLRQVTGMVMSWILIPYCSWQFVQITGGTKFDSSISITSKERIHHRAK